MGRVVTQYFCRTCQHMFRGRKGKGGRTHCVDCAKSSAAVDLFDALKQSLKPKAKP
jgi:hypothetical protein